MTLKQDWSQGIDQKKREDAKLGSELFSHISVGMCRPRFSPERSTVRFSALRHTNANCSFQSVCLPVSAFLNVPVCVNSPSLSLSLPSHCFPYLLSSLIPSLSLSPSYTCSKCYIMITLQSK